MSFLELAKSRYSVRRFSDKPIEKEKLDAVLEAAQIAPTGHNYQPQKIYIIRSEEALAKLQTVTKCTYGAKTVLLVAYDEEQEWKNNLEPTSTGVVDASIVATHIMLEAHEQGLGTCWVAWFAPNKTAEILDLPKNIKPVLLMPIGYPAEDSKPSPMHDQNKELSEFVIEL